MALTFDYKVRDRTGNLVQGQLEGDSLALVVGKLREMGYMPVAVTPKSTGGVRKEITIPGLSNRVKLAETALLKVIDQEPNQSGAYLILSQLYIAAGKQQAALDRLNALASKNNNFAAYIQMGVIYDAMKDYQKACEAYEKAIRANPNFAPAYNNISYDYAEKLNNLDKALPLAEKARDLAPRCLPGRSRCRAGCPGRR